VTSPDERARSSPVRAFAFATGPLLVLLVSGSAIAQTGTPPVAGTEPAPATASILRELMERVENLERRLSASALLELVSRLDRLGKEIRQLRDRDELQSRAIDDLQGRQRDLYAELDRLARRLVPAASPQGPDPSQGDSEGAGQATATEPGSDGDAAPSRIPQVSSGAGDLGAGTGTATAPDRDSSPPAYDPVEEQARYQRAFDLLSEGRFERAAAAFTEFLAAFPESRYRDDAMFWKGECLYALRRFEPALVEFRSLAETHPESSRIPGAKLKIGFILHELGRAAEAAEVLRDLANTAPDSSEAKLARDRLERLE